MLITVLSGVTIAILNPDTVKSKQPASKKLSDLTSDNAPSMFKIDNEPAAPDAAVAPAVQTEKKTPDLIAPPTQQKPQTTAPQVKASSAVILTLFRNIN